MASARWPFWPFGKRASSSPADFLHLSRTNIERICELIRLRKPLNPLQCSSMSSKLRTTIDSIKGLSSLLDDTNLFNGSVTLENFYRVSEKARRLVENCCRVDWCQASAFQIQNEEAFREILLEASLSYNSIRQLSEEIYKGVFLWDFCDPSTFDPPSVEEVFKDRIALQERLKGFVDVENKSTSNIRPQQFGQYLLGRVNFAIQHSPTEDLNVMSFNLWSDGKGPTAEWSKESEYLGGSVCKTTWFGIPCAKKLFLDTVPEGEWLREAEILANLNHPNIVKFLCCNKYENIHSKGHFIAMELMEISLASFIRRRTEGGVQLSLFSALDIMLQVGYGMCYLHDTGVSHRDLKTSNVLVCSINAPHLQNYHEVKIGDFGIAKVKLNQDKSNTITRPPNGTTTYMAPEAFSNGRANWFKADVYSFSVMCSVILSGEEPFQNMKMGDLCAAIRSGQRPNLPADTPKELISVISEGWATDRNLRPSFLDICTRLEKLRHRLLRGQYFQSLGLRLKGEDQYGVEYPVDLFIQEMMEKRSGVRHVDPSHSRLQVAMNLSSEEEWFDDEEVEKQPRSDQSQQQLLRGRVFQEEISIGIGVTEDGGDGKDGNSSSGGLQVSSCSKIGGGVDSPQDVGITLNMSSTSPPRPIPMDRETVESLNTSPLNTSPVGSRIGPPMDYLKEVSSSIKLIQELASGDQVQLHLRQCQYLSFKMSETGSFLKEKAKSLVCITTGDDIRWKALRQLHFTVKRAEKLLRSCCCEVEPSWLESAVTLTQIKEDIVDILLDLRWWTSMVDIAIASVTWVTRGLRIEQELLEFVEKDFQQLLQELKSRGNELDEALTWDKQQLLRRVRKLQRSYVGKPRDLDYLLGTHVRTRLENTDLVQSMANAALNEYKIMGFIGMGSFGAVMSVEWLGRSCAMKVLKFKCMKEATSLSSFQHPHIVQFFRYWEASVLSQSPKSTPFSSPRRNSTAMGSSTSPRVASVALPELSLMSHSHILMELLPTDLEQHMRHLATAAMPQDVAIDVMLQVTKAMWHLNNYNVSHRDLKPSNVLVEPVSPQEVPELAARGYVRVKLGDFGLANTRAMSMTSATGTKNVGTRMYGAPEVFVKDSPFPKELRRFPRLADVWSFGILFNEVLSGEPPFLEVHRKHGMGELHTRIQKGLRPQLPANCPDYLKFCITNCWQLRPQDRPSFADLWKLLRFAQVRSLGIIREDHNLFTFTTMEGVVKRLHKPKQSASNKDPKLSSFGFLFRRIASLSQRRWSPSTEAIQNSNREQSRAGSSKTQSEDKPLGYLVNSVDTQDSTSGSTELDVIFFEGNVGRRKHLSCKDTWVQRGKPAVWWPRDWLSKDFKGDIRVLLLEYSISENGVEGLVEDLQRFLVFSDRWNRGHTWNRPIVLVGHSLGCVVIEQLVVALNKRAKSFGSLKGDSEANRLNVSKSFLASLAGCFFYAPPYTGLVPSEDLLKYVFGGLTYSPTLFNDLCLTSPELKELSKRFMEASSDGVKLMALTEGFHTRGRAVVPPASMDAFIASGGRVEELIDSNHSDTCKPVDKKHPAYRILFEFIHELLMKRKVVQDTSGDKVPAGDRVVYGRSELVGQMITPFPSSHEI